MPFLQVRRWVLLHDPVTLCVKGYEEGVMAPGMFDLSGTAAYECLHNQILAHAQAYRVYQKDFAEWQEGMTSACLRAR